MADGLLWRPFEPAHIADPYSMYKALREKDPVHQSQTGEWIITRYSDAKTILKNPSFRSGNRIEWLKRGIQYFKNRDEDLTSISAAINSFILFLNPPDHMPIRNLVTKTWNDRDVDEMIKGKVAHQLSLLKQNEFDVVKDFAQPLPVLVVSEIMGIPLSDYIYLRGLGVTMMRALDLYHNHKDLVELNAAAKSFVQYFENLLAIKRKNKGNGLMDKLIDASDKGKILKDEQLISVFIFLFISGEETSAASIGTGLFNLLKDPMRYEGLRARPSTIVTAVDELLRYDPPVQLLGRISREEMSLGDHVIPKDSAFTIVLGSANRDPTQFPDPDNLNLARDPNHHLAFGSGVHFCLGDWLGKTLLHHALLGFIGKFPRVSIPPQTLLWNKNLSVRALQSLMVKVNEYIAGARS